MKIKMNKKNYEVDNVVGSNVIINIYNALTDSILELVIDTNTNDITFDNEHFKFNSFNDAYLYAENAKLVYADKELMAGFEDD